MNNEQLKSIALLKVALATATNCRAFDLLVGDAQHPDDINHFCDLVQAVALPEKLVADLARLTATAPVLAKALKSLLQAYNVPRACCNEANDALEQAWPDFQREQEPLQVWDAFIGEKIGSTQTALAATSH